MKLFYMRHIVADERKKSRQAEMFLPEVRENLRPCVPSAARGLIVRPGRHPHFPLFFPGAGIILPAPPPRAPLKAALHTAAGQPAPPPPPARPPPSGGDGWSSGCLPASHAPAGRGPPGLLCRQIHGTWPDAGPLRYPGRYHIPDCLPETAEYLPPAGSVPSFPAS